MPRTCSGLAPYVFRCFKVVEGCADTLTGAAGPVFVALCWALILAGGFMFAEIVYPYSRTYLPLGLHLILFLPCLTIAFNLYSHYYLVTTVSPGRPDDGNGRGNPSREGWWFWAQKRAGGENGMQGERRRRNEGWQEEERELIRDQDRDAGVNISGEESGVRGLGSSRRRRKERKCRKDGGSKPERAHHCRVCKSCILKYDHHCPWINGCVGLRNERHFVLFMVYLVAGCFFFVAFGFPLFLPSLDMFYPWPYWTPRIAFTLECVLALALGIAVAIMASWHILQLAWAETSVEGHDNEYYRLKAIERGQGTFENGYDLGWKWNLKVGFLNLGPEGGYSYWTLFIPFRIETRSDGWTWDKREGYRGVNEADELTDDEEGGGIWT